MSLMQSLIRPVSLLLAFTTTVSQPLAIAVTASAAPMPTPIPYFMPDDDDDHDGSGDTLIATQQDVFEQLFQTPWSAEAWTYPLYDKVEGLGVYKGSNQYAQSFELDIVVAQQVDLEAVGLPQEHFEFAKSRGFEYFGVIGTLKTRFASIPVTGVAFSQGSDVATSQSYFMLVDTVDPDSALFNPLPAAEVRDETDNPVWVPAYIPKFCPDTDCIRECEEQRQRCIDAANAEYLAEEAVANADFTGAEASARATRQLAVSSANTSFDAAKSTAETHMTAALLTATAALVAAHVLCAFSLFFALTCVVAAQAVYATAVAAALVTRDASVRLAEVQRNTAIELAQRGYSDAVATARAAQQATLRALKRTLQRDLRACDDAFNVCIGSCVPIICGWRMIWIRIR